MNRICNCQESNYVKLFNRGGFISNLTVSYTHCGRRYEFDSGAFTLGFSAQISFPCDATNIHVSVQVAVYYDFWEPIFCKTYKTARDICLFAWGIIGCSPCVEIPCTSPMICNCNNRPMYY